MVDDRPGMWPPRSYPMETCTSHAATAWQMTSEPKDETPELPTTISALKDSSASYAKGRNLVICLDGTGDQFDSDNSNVVKFVACLKKDDPSQVTYYQSGIGTYDGHGGLKNGISAALDMAVGSGLGRHIMDAYHFLMQNYHEGDRICLLGFSRGSYTVRCLAGMLHKVGLLPAHNRAQITFAYQFYKNDSPEGWKMSAEFRRTFCINVSVYFVGVWDCVAAVGFIPRKLPFGKSPTNTVRYFRHAMALDEHRAKFKVCHYQQQNPAAATGNTVRRATAEAAKKGWHRLHRAKHESASPSDTIARPTTPHGIASKLHSKGFKEILDMDDNYHKQSELEKKFEKAILGLHKEKIASDVLEVWFAGAHADVGGGAVRNEERHMLSRIPLRWMIRQCFECNTGILFSTDALAEMGLDIPSLWPVYRTRKQPVVGPSPKMVEWYEAGILPALRHRSAALTVHEDEKKKRRGKRRHGSAGGNWWELDHPELLPEHVEDHFDAMAPINDQLQQSKSWWILEFWPIKLRVLKQKKAKDMDSDEGNWRKVVGLNLGRYRAIRETEPKMHWTVQMRMSEKGYRVQNNMDQNTCWQIAC